MAYKRCHEIQCPEGARFKSGKAATARCKHEWYISAMHDGRRERGPVSDYPQLAFRGEPFPDNKTDAEEWERRLKTWLRTGQAPGVGLDPEPEAAAAPPSWPLIRAAAARYQTEHIAKGNDTGAPYLVARLAADVGHRTIDELLTPDVFTDWFEDLQEEEEVGEDGQRRSSTMNRYRAKWSHLITFCRIKYKLTGPPLFYHPILNPAVPVGSPLRRLKETRRTRRLKPGEEKALLRAAHRDAMMTGRIYCALDCGLRRREMLLVDVEHIQKTRDGVAIYVPAGNAKGRKERWVTVGSKRLLQWLKGRVAQLTRTFGEARGARFVFGQPDGARLDSFRGEWEAVQMDARLKVGAYVTDPSRKWKGRATVRDWVWTYDAGLHWHDLRHECGSRLAQGTAKTVPVPLRDIQLMLGHAKLATTEIYLQTTPESVARNVRRVQRALGL